MVMSHDTYHGRRASTRRAARLMAGLLLTAPPLLGAARAPSTSRAFLPTPLLITLEPDHAVYVGDMLTISASVPDPALPRVNYQFLFDGATIQPWSAIGFCRRTLTLSDLGLHRIEAQVRGSHREAREEATIYVYRRPPAPLNEGDGTIR